MSAPNSKEESSLISKLILLVLVGILGCLAVLVVRQRNFMAALDQRAKTRAAEDQQAALEQSVEPAPVISQRPARLPVTASAQPPAFVPETSTAPAENEIPPPVATSATQPQAVAILPQLVLVSSAPGFHAGDVSGIVGLSGTPPREIPIQMDATCGRLQTNTPTTRHFVTTRDGRLANVLVYVKGGLPPISIDPPPATPLLDQRACFFEPYILGVMTGQKFQIGNSDPFLHNVHAMTSPGSGNREFNIGQPIQGQVVEKSFAKPEIFVKMKCDVHPWMFAYIGVVDHPYFAVTDKDGNFQLPYRLPPGTYTLAARHQKAGELTLQITVGRHDQQPVAFTFQLK